MRSVQRRVGRRGWSTRVGRRGSHDCRSIAIDSNVGEDLRNNLTGVGWFRKEIVATFGERVVDVFYVTDLLGAQIISPTRQAAIKRALIALFAVPEGNGKSGK